MPNHPRPSHRLLLPLTLVVLVAALWPTRASAQGFPFLPPIPPQFVIPTYSAPNASTINASLQFIPAFPGQQYFVDYSTDGGASWWGQTSTTGSGITMPCPQNDRPTLYRVIAHNNLGYASPTISWPITCHSRPALPTNFSATRLSDTSIRVQWTDNATNESSYWIYLWYRGLTNSMLQPPVPANSTSATLTGLLPHTLYYVQLVPRTNNDLTGPLGTDWITVATGAPAALPLAPTGLTAVTASTSEIDLAWSSAETGPHALEIQHSTDGHSWDPTPFREDPSTATAAVDSSLPAASRHYYRARYTNATGNSAYSNIATAFTYATCAPPAPSGLTATATSSTTVHLHFTDNSSGGCNEEVFLLSMSYDNGATWYADFANTTFNDVDIVNIPANTPTTYRVRATT